MDKLTTSEKVILGGAIAYLIFMFFPWYGIEDVSDAGNTGWDYFLGGIIPLILILVMAVQIIITRFSPDTKLPDPPVPWGQVHLFAGAAAAVIVLLRTIIGSDVEVPFVGDFDLDRKVGLFLALIAAIVVAVGGYLKSQEGDVGPVVDGDTGTAPF
ncbi:MAG: hypothetical protein ACJ739_06750 [Acidimicrobiales bacterium]